MLARSPPVTTIDTFLLTVDWGEILLHLTAYAGFKYFEGSNEDIAELVQEAVRHLLDPTYRKWVEANPTMDSLLSHLRSEINAMVIDRRRLRQRRGPHLPAEHALRAMSSPAPGPEAQLEANDWCYQVLEHLEGRKYASELFYLIMDGTTEPAEQAEALGWTIGRVYEARRVIRDTIREMRDA